MIVPAGNTALPDFMDPAITSLVTQNQTVEWAETVNGVSAFAFKPGWSLQRHLDIGGYGVDDWSIATSTGVDCVGFVQRSQSYLGGNYYVWPNVYGHRVNGDQHYEDKKKYDIAVARNEDWYSSYRTHVTSDMNDPRYSWQIVGKSSFIEIIENGDKIKIWPRLDNVKPGDVIELWGGAHIAMVLDVYDSDGNGRIDPQEVMIIESTYDDLKPIVLTYDIARVVSRLDGRTLLRYRDISNWEIVRLVMK
jgi:hypothetical protein